MRTLFIFLLTAALIFSTGCKGRSASTRDAEEEMMSHQEKMEHGHDELEHHEEAAASGAKDAEKKAAEEAAREAEKIKKAEEEIEEEVAKPKKKRKPFFSRVSHPSKSSSRPSKTKSSFRSSSKSSSSKAGQTETTGSHFISPNNYFHARQLDEVHPHEYPHYLYRPRPRCWPETWGKKGKAAEPKKRRSPPLIPAFREL